MRKSNAFRPATLALEDRLALNGAWAALDAGSPSTPTPAEIVAAAREQADFETFKQGYQAAVQSTLMAPGKFGIVNAKANRAAFDTQVDGLIKTLQTDLIADVKALPNALKLDVDIHTTLLGSSSTSLENELLAVPTPVGASSQSLQSFEAASLSAMVGADESLASDALGHGLITPG